MRKEFKEFLICYAISIIGAILIITILLTSK
jgi:hypothetical protein